MSNKVTELYIARDRSMHPPAYAPEYKTSVLRSPRKPLLSLQQSLSEITGPVFGHEDLDPLDNDLLHNARVDNDPIGERIVVHGRVLDHDARPVRGALIEVWQANAGGRYRHVNDHYIAALDPNFSGCGRCITDDSGAYFFRTVKPGPYPWRNRINDWRPAHIHFSLFGRAFVTRLITQMYFEGDPLLPLCPIYNAIPDAGARARLVAPLDTAQTIALDALAYRFDIVLRGTRQTFFENSPGSF
jgi:protocatechuate 3,4-dioxygenase, beta subunit